MGDTKGSNTLFARMMKVGDLLIAAQALEQDLAIICSEGGTPDNLARWKESRRWVESCAGDYAAAVREWREDIQLQVVREFQPSDGRGFRGWSARLAKM
jgi:hypothetical protein